MKRYLVILLTIVGCSKTPTNQDSCGYVRNGMGNRVSWSYSLPVTLFIHESVPEVAYPTIRRAAASWGLINVVPCQGVCGPKSKDGRNVLYWSRTWKGIPEEQGNTQLYFIGPRIIDGDININGQNYVYSFGTQSETGKVDFESLILHEMGHLLGLDHDMDRESVMFPYLWNGQVRRSLAVGDVEKLKCEYK